LYAELKLTLKKPITRENAIDRIKEVIGNNSIDIKDAVEDSPIKEIAKFALLAESIPPRAIIVYAIRGNDTIVANILAKSLSQLREECKRISRQLSSKELKIGDTNASILVEVNGVYSDILTGEKVSFRKRWWDAMCDKFWGRFIPAIITAGAASHFLANTPAVTSAIIGLVAATGGALFEAVIAARAGTNWKWKEST
jgi:hypothetical protein